MVFNIQRFSLHDGPGIRTTAFFAGCPLRCKWCHNPQSQGADAEDTGIAYAPDALAELLMKDRQLFDTSGGGVTLSGGEPLAQDGDYMIALLKLLKRRGIHVALDSCGYAPYEKIEALLPYIDLWLYDLKAMDDAIHLSATAVSNALILANLHRLANGNARVWLRIPVVPSINDSAEQMRQMADFAKGLPSIERICLLPYHKLGQEAPSFVVPTPARLDGIKGIWRDRGFSDIQIGG